MLNMRKDDAEFEFNRSVRNAGQLVSRLAENLANGDDAAVFIKNATEFKTAAFCAVEYWTTATNKDASNFDWTFEQRGETGDMARNRNNLRESRNIYRVLLPIAARIYGAEKIDLVGLMA